MELLGNVAVIAIYIEIKSEKIFVVLLVKGTYAHGHLAHKLFRTPVDERLAADKQKIVAAFLVLEFGLLHTGWQPRFIGYFPVLLATFMQGQNFYAAKRLSIGEVDIRNALYLQFSF